MAGRLLVPRSHLLFMLQLQQKKLNGWHTLINVSLTFCQRVSLLSFYTLPFLSFNVLFVPSLLPFLFFLPSLLQSFLALYLLLFYSLAFILLFSPSINHSFPFIHFFILSFFAFNPSISFLFTFIPLLFSTLYFIHNTQINFLFHFSLSW